jgi:8-oxo-dGTP diphosphatase
MASAARGETLPRIRVAALLARGDEVLLVEHQRGDARYFLLPGGGVSFGETLEEALRREVAEECGLSVIVGAPLLLSDTISPARERHVVNVVFAAEESGKVDAKPDHRVAGCVWLPVSQLGAVALHPPIASHVARAVAEGLRGPARYLGPLWTEAYDRTESRSV